MTEQNTKNEITEDSITDEKIDDAIFNDEDTDIFNDELDDDEFIKVKSIKENDLNDLDVSLLLQKTNRILAGDEKIVVRDLTNRNAPACADCTKSSIFINYKFAQNLKTLKTLFDYLTLIKGLNYHELAHILFTDYSINKITKFLQEKYSQNSQKANAVYVQIDDYRRNLNLLEDCRIESLFYILYPRARYYFTFTASNIILKDYFDKYTPEQLISTYLVLYGRKFMGIGENKLAIARLRLGLIKKIEDAKGIKFDIKLLIKEAEKIVDEYIIEKDSIERLELAYKLTLLMTDANVNLNSSSDDGSIEKGKARKGTKQRISDASDKLSEEMKKGENKSGKIEKSDNKDNKENTKEEKEKDTDAKNGDTEKLLNDMLESMKEDVENSDEIQNEIRKEISSLTASNSEFGGYSGNILEFDKSANEIKRVENILRRLRGDLSSQLFRFQKKGKVDILSVMKSQKNGNFNIFRKLKQNRIDKSKLGVVFLLDTSGSINADDFRNEISATYCFTNALEKLDNKIEVIEFSTTCKTLKKFNSEGDWKRTYCGGTRVLPPLEVAIKDLILLKRNESIENLFIIVVSDGCFDEDAVRLTPTLEKAKKSGIKTMWINASAYKQARPEVQRLFNWFFQIKNLSDLSAKLSSIIKDIQKEINKKILKQDNFFGA